MPKLGLIFCLAIIGLSDNLIAETISPSRHGLGVSLDGQSGSYEITSLDTKWTFIGFLNVSPHGLNTHIGHDSVGQFDEIIFHFDEHGVPLTGRIRAYADEPAAIFYLTYDRGASSPVAAFPAFTNIPRGLHSLSFAHMQFAPPVFEAPDGSTPWLLFDDSDRAAIISPAAHFSVAHLSGDGQTLISSGLADELQNIPPGFTQQTLLVLDDGINRAWDHWGSVLMRMSGKIRPKPDADIGLKYLGYWTDNGCYYYYNYDHDKGYAGTLLAVARHFREQHIPVRYLQLDSWWYYKSFADASGKQGKTKNSKLPKGEWNRYGGLMLYKAHHDLFPDGLLAFQKQIGLPLITHNRWVDPASPYHERYKFSGVAGIDPAWWNEIASYLKSNGVFTYEQDWLNVIEDYSPQFSSTPQTSEEFFNGMANACRASGLSMQYCMPLPDEIMQGSRYGNLTTSRVSDDRFDRNRWRNFLFTSRLAWALGIYPWTDPCYSTETDNLLLSVLSSGMVGFGDPMGKESKNNLLRAVRADGVIVKPDEPIVPIDAAYQAGDDGGFGTPLIAATHTDHNGLRTAYVFAFASESNADVPIRFSPSQLGMAGPVFVLDYFAGKGRRMNAKDMFTGALGDHAAVYYEIAPIGPGGIAFLGDAGKFVSTGKQRIAAIENQSAKLTATILLAPGEGPIRLRGFTTRKAPSVAADGGSVGPVSLDAQTSLFSVAVYPDPASTSVMVTLNPR